MTSDRRAAVVTGATGALGSAICRELAASGRDILVHGRAREREAADLCVELRKHDVHAAYALADLTQPGEAARLFEFADAQFGRVDVLVNAVGSHRDGRVESLSADAWHSVLATNVTGIFHACQQAVPRMKARDFGRIVNLSSVVGITGGFGISNYVAAKAAVVGFTKALATETARQNITANTVCPGYMESPMLREIPEKVLESIRQRIPKKRFGTPEDVARAVGFLTRDDVDYITGQTLVLDGGFTLG